MLISTECILIAVNARLMHCDVAINHDQKSNHIAP